jgi:prepilin-type N-terminal cleavage/methylation domain-containing protein
MNLELRTLNPEQENGFTVVELLAAMVVSSLVVGFVVSMYLFSERLLARHQKDSNVKRAVSGCVQRIIMDVESSDKMVRCDDTSLVFSEWIPSPKGQAGEQNPFKEIKYHFDASHAWRNGVLVNDPQIELNVHISFDEDTTADQPTRFWNIRVVGWEETPTVKPSEAMRSIKDSVNVSISTMISSQELVDRGIQQSAR